MRVLYVEHTGLVSGAEHSLLAALGALPNGVQPVIACPDGPLVERLTTVGIERLRVSGTTVSLRLHPRHTVRGVANLSQTAAELAALVRRHRIDLVHANTLPAGIAAALSPLGRPLVLHVRDVLPNVVSSWAVRAVLRRVPEAVIAISRYAAEQFGSSRGRLRVLDNPVDLGRFDPSLHDGREVRQRLGLATDAPVLGMVGQITPWKGHLDAIRALTRVHRDVADAVLLIVGEPKFTSPATRFDNVAYLNFLRATIERAGIGDRVRFLGERDDVPALLTAMDVVLVPSWEEPFGRTVAEAMAMARPVLATSLGGPSEIIANGVTGQLLPPRQPDAWGLAIRDVLVDRTRADAMAGRARDEAVQRFGPERHARELVEVYDEVLADRR